MADTPLPRAGDNIPPGATSPEEAPMFDDIIGKLGTLPDGVERVDYHFGEDSEGSPAIWISLVAHDDLKPSKQKIAALQRFAAKARSEVFRSPTARWRYVEVVTE